MAEVRGGGVMAAVGAMAHYGGLNTCQGGGGNGKGWE